jgi:hypothetical protein
MKALNIIISAMLVFQVGFLFAANAGEPIYKGTSDVTIEKTSTIPSASRLSARDEKSDIDNSFISLAPATPKEADFSEESTNNNFILENAAPSVPSVADFNDTVVSEINVRSIAPFTPAEADFE